MTVNLRLFLSTLLTVLLYQSVTATEYWRHNEQQGDAGSCHTFTTIALVEAEYWKQTGKHINLSERDLFIRHFTKDYATPELCLRSHLRAATIKKLPHYYKESGHIAEDFKLLKKHGVASEKELPYSPRFKLGVGESMKVLRAQRNAIFAETQKLKRSNQWSPLTRTSHIQRHLKKLRSVKKVLTLPAHTKTRAITQPFLSRYSLQATPLTSTPRAKKKIIQLLKHRPVAVDITNLNELTGQASSLHISHSLVVSSYDAKSDLFTIRSSTHNRAKKVSANALSRGAFKLYYLKKK